jgi:glucose-6-phosphate 1-epimerase
VIPGALAFDEPVPGFIRALVATASCDAELYLRGAHLTRWQPAGASPVLFLSPRAVYARNRPIYGGIPVIFPWFGARSAAVTGSRTGGPEHGFAWDCKWAIAEASRGPARLCSSASHSRPAKHRGRPGSANSGSRSTFRSENRLLSS